ncbi:MAG: phage tail protein [Nibricoccus sp.]
MNYPLPRNHFQVEWGGVRIGFCEVSGLAIEMEAPAFRDGSSKDNSNVTMPGAFKFRNLVLKRALEKGDDDFYEWLNKAKLNTTERRDVTVSLLDENHQPAMVWVFKRAFPVKLEYSTLDAQNCGPMMEVLEVTHEGMVVKYSN